MNRICNMARIGKTLGETICANYIPILKPILASLTPQHAPQSAPNLLHRLSISNLGATIHRIMHCDIKLSLTALLLLLCVGEKSKRRTQKNQCNKQHANDYALYFHKSGVGLAVNVLRPAQPVSFHVATLFGTPAPVEPIFNSEMSGEPELRSRTGRVTTAGLKAREAHTIDCLKP